MTDTAQICVTATAETALKKLKKAGLDVYNCKKQGTRFIFSVKDKHIKKVFAIFANPCYNINVIGESRRSTFLSLAITRIGLIIGAVLFVVIAAVSNSFVFKITVSGSGSYLSPEVKRIIYESGVKEFAYFSGFDEPYATGRILALPEVTFCNIRKKGSILHVDVQVDSEHNSAVKLTSLVSDCSGTVKNIVAICGTAVVSAGDTVKKGSTLIAAYTTVGEQQTESIAVGYAEIECKGTAEYSADCESDENERLAYSSVLISADEIVSRSHTVKQTDGGVIYVIQFTYLRKLSINME